MQLWQILLMVFACYWVTIFVLGRLKILERINASSWGPIFTIRTERAKKTIDRISRPKKFWHWFGIVSIAICATTAAVLLVEFILQFPLIFEVEEPIDPRLALAIPIINPIFPLFYGLFGLFIGVIVHEFTHGIQMRSHGMTLKSLGLVFILFPIGAFAEPDEEELLKAKRSHRAKIYSSGPGMNIILAFLLLGILAGAAHSLDPTEGAIVTEVSDDSPLADMDLETPFILLSINSTKIGDPNDYIEVCKSLKENQTVELILLEGGETRQINASGPSFGLFQQEETILSGEYKGYSGGYAMSHSTTDLTNVHKNPLSSSSDFSIFMMLPFLGLQPISGDLSVYLGAPFDGFWLIYNVLYWVFWVSLLVGAFNALPIYPLDGGWLFRDFSTSVAKRFTKDEDRAERIARSVTSGISMFTIALVIAPLLIPWFL